jgi:putative endonuclease
MSLEAPSGAKWDWNPAMHYVYLIQSISHPEQKYTSSTSDLRKRLLAHNNGESLHTAKFVPWKLVGYLAFDNKQRALDFEKYLKSGSGGAFAKKRLWPV